MLLYFIRQENHFKLKNNIDPFHLLLSNPSLIETPNSNTEEK
ncbi:hypothetical protein FLAVO9R_70322 [Flavobacterium sp. 9R]|nr:hypothetical protein FLAVO9R_70322 [Flavobacterium sp. 9R]